MDNPTDRNPPPSAVPTRRQGAPASGWKATFQRWLNRPHLGPDHPGNSGGSAAEQTIEMDEVPARAGESGHSKCEAHFRSLIESSIQGIHVHKNFRPVFVNQACADMFGYDSPAEILALKSTQELLPPHERTRTQEYGKARLRGQPAPQRYEVQGLRKDGTIIWIEQRCDVVEWDGEPAIQVMQVDITEQKEAEQRIRASERRFRDLVEGSVQGICIHSNFLPIFANQACADIFGYDSPDEVCRLESSQELVAPEERERLKGYALARMSGKDVPNRYIVRGIRKDGARIWIEQAARLIDWDGEPAIQLTLVDVTEQKESEQALRAGEQRMKDLIAGSIQGISILKSHKLIFTNRIAANLYGYASPEEMLALDSVEKLVSPGDWPRLREYAEAREKGRPVPDEYEYKGKKKDGTEFWLLQRVRRIDWDGEPATQITAIDITEQKLALQKLQDAYDNLEDQVEERTRKLADEILDRKSVEQALRVSEERYRNLFESMQDGVFLVKDLRIVLANESLAHLLGYEVDDMIDRDFTDFLVPESRDMVKDLHSRRLQGEDVANRYEADLLNADQATTVSVLMNLKVIKTPSGDNAVLGTVRDITERKRAELALKESEERFRAVIDNSPTSISLKDADGRYLLINAEYEHCHRVSRDEILGKTVHNGFPASAAETASGRDAEVLETGEVINFEIEVPDSDGQAHTRFVTKFPIRDANGEISRIGTIGTDITDLKMAERALRESEEQLRAIMENAKAVISLKDLDGRFLVVNRAYEECYGIPPEEVLGKTSSDLLGPKQSADIHERERKVKETGKPVTTEISVVNCLDGAVRDYHVVKFPVKDGAGEVAAIGTFAVEFTERKKAENALRESEERFRGFAQSSSDWLWELDAEGRFIYFSNRIFDILGYPAKDMVGKTATEVSAAFGIGDGWRSVDNLITQRKPVRDVEYELFGINGIRRVVRTSGTPRFSETGEYLGYLGTTTDITDEVMARENEAQVQQHFLAAIETVPVGIALFDADDSLVVANERYRENLVSDTDLEPGTSFESILRNEIDSGAVQELGRSPESWIQDRLEYHRKPEGVLEIQKTNGYFRLREHGTDEGFTLVVVHDITDRKMAEQALLDARDELELRVQERTRALEQEVFERKYAQTELQKANEMLEERVEERTRHLSEEIAERKRFEEQFIQAQKMEAVGQMAGGIAHDFNNLLTVVIANLGWLRDILKRDEKAIKIIDLALEGARRAGELTQRMLAFSRRQDLHPLTINFTERFGEMESLILRALRESIHLSVDIDSDLWPMEVDPHQLESSLLNIAINARDAMPDGGTLTLKGRNRVISESSGPAGNPPGEYVELSLSDTGSGMPREVLDRVMDPFFTTKEVGKGTGLGLSMVFGFAKQSGGFLEIESEVEVGTTVNLLLPRSQNPCAPTPPIIPETTPVLQADIKVLVVEDDEMVRTVTVEYLSMSGIEGMEADCGATAIKLLQDHGPFDLVISDVIMPGKSGIELTETINERWPGTRTILMTGYSYEEFTRRGIDPADLMLLHKPFSKQELLAKLQEALAIEVPQSEP